MASGRKHSLLFMKSSFCLLSVGRRYVWFVWSFYRGQQQPHPYLFVPATKKKKPLGQWRVEGKKSGATTPVYNHIMESKWPNTIRRRILFTGFTLCVVLGEC